MQDWQHQQNLQAAAKLQAEGYEFTITSDKYEIRYQGEFVHAAGVKLPREKKPHWQKARANVRDFWEIAISEAEKHKRRTSQLSN
ncbi:hypothetical protein FD723_40220 (plasmid) [Nostoc sp. C052]|uniref:hypothetical protein n=1 Tax=Nostoc sp. C052 TaxID=2576902 RepID=UPI0015C4040D|nr:hypothetical protein [Nostoc sp. C052]QLE46440.1 hypothetical protein FD723_40220 [Nostoc sp. C052]